MGGEERWNSAKGKEERGRESIHFLIADIECEVGQYILTHMSRDEVRGDSEGFQVSTGQTGV